MSHQAIQISFPGLKVGIVENDWNNMRGLEASLAAMGCEIIWKARNEEEAQAEAAKQLPQVAFVDLRLHAGSNGHDHQPGWELIKHFYKQKQGKPFAAIIYTGTPMTDSIALEAIRMGCSYIVKEDLWEKDTLVLASALLAALSNSVMLSHEVATELETIVNQLETSNLLSEREWDILALVADGLTNNQIAKRKFIEVSTVKSHVSSILGKLKMDTRGKAAEWYRQYKS